ncbi:hypothetical protein FRC04_000336 [Tulasnella sp. 424]|nr:hypothetical protein FRC04_000336 [Tulasnella sp. 424]KAG8982196.1 hypothetical protein FRC05_000338 [Tulasnella sp. 425]
MNQAASDIYPVIDTWPLRRNFQQKFDTYGRQIWTDRLTHALLTAALLFPLHSAPGRGMKYGRNEIISLYLYQQTGILRSPRQCGSKLQHLYTCEEIKSAVENYQPAPDASKRDELLVHLLPLVPSLRSAQAERPPTPPPRKGRPYSGPKAEFIKISSGATSASFSLLGYAARTDPAAIISGAVALELSDLAPRTPVLRAHVVLPPNLNVELWGGIQIELVVPGANSVEYHTLTWIAEASGPDCLVKATPTAGARFIAPVAPGSLPDILRVWSSEERRRQLMPDVSIVQRFRARRKGGKMNKDDFVVIVYSLEIAEEESEVSMTIQPAIVIPPSAAVKDLPFALHDFHEGLPLQAQPNLPPSSASSDPPQLELATPYVYAGQAVYCESLMSNTMSSSHSDTTYNISPSSTTCRLRSPSDAEDHPLPPSPVPISSITITAPKPRPPNPFEHVQWLGPSNSGDTGGTPNGDPDGVQVLANTGMSNDELARPPFNADTFTLNATTGLDLSMATSSASSSFPSSLQYQALEAGHEYQSLGNPVEYYLDASNQEFFQVPPFIVDGEVTLCAQF